MNTPNKPKDDPEKAWPEWQEPFPEPQTIPTGWDVSGMVDEPVPPETDAEMSD